MIYGLQKKKQKHTKYDKQTGEDSILNCASGLFQYMWHLLVEGSVSVSSLWGVTHWGSSNGARCGITRHSLVASFFGRLWRTRWSLIKRGMEWKKYTEDQDMCYGRSHKSRKISQPNVLTSHVIKFSYHSRRFLVAESLTVKEQL